MSLLSARDLWVAPPAEGGQRHPARTPAIRGFSLELGPGEWLAVRGPNGCGKTTLLLALAGLWPARSGDLLLEGRPFGPGMPEERRARVAVILQDPSSQLLQPTVREELAFSALNLGHPIPDVVREVERWSERLGLVGDLDRDPQELSAGRQQLVLLAAALVTQPSLLLADEPAAHLDRESRRRVLEALRGEVGRGLSVVWVTQDDTELAFADSSVDLADREEPLPAQVTRLPGAQGEPASPCLTMRVSPWGGGGGPAVKTSVTLEIPVAGKGVTAIEGPNAVGKSVLLGVAAGVLRSEQVQVTGWTDPEPPAILCSQFPELEIFEEQARDEVTYAAVSRGVPPALALQLAIRLLERLGPGCAGLLERPTWGLSGGEKRLVSLVSALIAPASLCVLDEPTAGLDPRRRLALLEIVGECSQRAPVLLASQDGRWLDGLAAHRYTLGAPASSPDGCHSKETG